MGKNFLCLSLLTALLAGCAAGESSSQPDQSEPPEQPPAVSEPAAGKPAGEVFVDDPDSPYPMVVERWQMDLDGDGAD